MRRRLLIQEVKKLELVHEEMVLCRDALTLTRRCQDCGLVHSLTVLSTLIKPRPNRIELLYQPAFMSCCGYVTVIYKQPWRDVLEETADYRYAFLLEVYRAEHGNH